jgi:hypothetical protein
MHVRCEEHRSLRKEFLARRSEAVQDSFVGATSASGKVDQFARDLASARAKIREPCFQDEVTLVSAAGASKTPSQSFAAFFALPVRELLHPPPGSRSLAQRLTHSFLPAHPELEEEFHSFFRARFLQLNRRAIWAVVMVIFTLSFYEQASDLESTPFVARGVWACHFIAFGTGLAWLWFTSQREEWYAKNLDSMALLIISVQSILFITICLFYNTLGTSYGTGMCLLLLSVISMFSSMNFLYALAASVILLAYYAIAGMIWYRTVPGIIVMLIAGCIFYVRSAYDSSYSLRKIFLRKRNQIAETNLSMQLLDNMLPPHILNLMRLSEFIALAHVASDILFSDIVQLTALASIAQPIDLVAILNVMFSSFDREALAHDVYKVETIGDGQSRRTETDELTVRCIHRCSLTFSMCVHVCVCSVSRMLWCRESSCRSHSQLGELRSGLPTHHAEISHGS